MTFFFFWHLRFMARVNFGQRMRINIQGRHEDESSLPSLLLQYWLFNAANCRSSSRASVAADWDICCCIVPRLFGSVFPHCLWCERISPSLNGRSHPAMIRQIAGVSAFVVSSCPCFLDLLKWLLLTLSSLSPSRVTLWFLLNTIGEFNSSESWRVLTEQTYTLLK